MLDWEFEIAIAPGANLPASLLAGFIETAPEGSFGVHRIPVTSYHVLREMVVEGIPGPRRLGKTSGTETGYACAVLCSR